MFPLTRVEFSTGIQKKKLAHKILIGELETNLLHLFHLRHHLCHHSEHLRELLEITEVKK